MSRKPINVLIIPFILARHGTYKFALFKRKDLDCWQGIAGGVEEGETIIEAARRECFEEAQICFDSKFIKLDTVSSIPRTYFSGDWSDNVYIVTEYSFGVEVKNQKLNISTEHSEYGWFNYGEAMEILRWDSNRTALWELNERIKSEGGE